MNPAALLGWLAFANVVDAPSTSDPFGPAAARPAAWIASINPVAPIAGRWGANLELLLADRHGLRASGSWVDLDTWAMENGTGLIDARGVDTEVGYRFYARDATGLAFFVGPALTLGAFRGSESFITAGIDPAIPRPGPVSFTQVAVAADVGARYTMRAGFTVAFALGAKYAFVSESFDDPRDFRLANVSQRGIGPRLLTEVGWAF